tara:strand:+ start:549 stop:1703 length:1155 start_codon:yes stop_codon:yes gene_type:complete
MGDFEKVNDVAAADIEKVNDIAKSSIQNINGVDTPSSGQVATRWVMGHDGNGSNWYISYCAHSDRTSWTGTTAQSSTPDVYDIAYGKDGSGNPLWATVNNSGSMEIAHDGNNDITDSSTWTKVNVSKKCRTIEWGNNVWIAMGHMDASNRELYRSTDGSSWSEVDLSGVSGIQNAVTVFGLASDGAGSWMFGQGSNIFASTDNGSTWAEMTSYPGANVCDIGFTNNTWVVLDAGTPGQLNTVGASAFATEMGGGSNATWGTQELTSGGDSITTADSGAQRTVIACGDGVVIAAHSEYTMSFDVNGTSISIRSPGRKTVGEGEIVEGDIETIATDGNGTWLIGSFGGDIAESTDNGANWTQIVDNFSFNGERENLALRANVYLPV